jgi:acyl-CoA synthetase (NDP forming)
MGYLGEVEAKTFLAKRGLPVNPTYQVDNLEVAREKGEELGYPVVLKVSSEKIVHKSDIGGVIPGISNSRELEEAFQSLEKDMRTIDSQASFSIQPHIFSSLELVFLSKFWMV